MEFGTIAQFGSLALAALALLISVIGARSKAVKDAIDGVHTHLHDKADKRETDDLFVRMRHAEEKIAHIESELDHLPDKDTAHRLELAISQLGGKMEALDERMRPVASMANRMQEFMLERSKS